MSFQATDRIINWPGLSPTEKAVGHAIAHHCNPRSVDHCSDSYPSVETIAREAGLKDKRYARRVIRDLEELGVVSATSSNAGGKGRTTHYKVNPPKGGLYTPVSELELTVKA